MKKLFITFSKKDIKKGRITSATLSKVIGYVGDKSWCEGIDFPDTMQRAIDGDIVGISYISYKKYDKEGLNTYLAGTNKKGEYIDVFPEDVEMFRNWDKVEEVKFKDILAEANAVIPK